MKNSGPREDASSTADMETGTFWKKKFDVEALMDWARNEPSLGKLELLYPVLASAADFHKAVPEVVRTRLVREALLSGCSDPDSLARGVLTSAKAYLAKPIRELALLTSVSVEPCRSGRCISEGTVRTQSQIPRNFDVEKAESLRIRDSIDRTPTHYSIVVVCAQARCSEGIREVGFESLDFVRGVWTLALEGRRLQLTLLPLSSPHYFGKFFLGPWFTMHDARTGEQLGDELGVITNYRSKASISTDAFREVRRFEDTVLRKVQKINRSYRRRIQVGFARFARAFDGSDYAVCLLKLWALCEYLTGSEGNSDQLIKKTSSLFRNPEPGRSTLIHLRDHRNEIAHAGSSYDEFGEALVQQAIRFARALLFFHVFDGHKFESFGEACKFLALPQDHTMLRREIRLRELVLSRKS